MSVTERWVVWLGVGVGGLGILVCLALLAGAFVPFQSPRILLTMLIVAGVAAIAVGAVTRLRDRPVFPEIHWPSLVDPTPGQVRAASIAWWLVLLHTIAWVAFVLAQRSKGVLGLKQVSPAAGAVFMPMFLYLVLYHLLGRDRVFPNWRMGFRLLPGYWIGHWLGTAARKRRDP